MDVRYLQALKERRRFNAIKGYVPKGMVSPEILAMMQWFDVYFSTFPEHESIQTPELRWLIQQRAGDASPESMAILLHLVDQLDQPIDEGTINGVLGSLYDLDFAGRAGAMLAAFDRGEDIDIVHDLGALAREVKRAKSHGQSDEYLQESVLTILDTLENDQGLKFRRLPALAQALQPLQGGASVAVAARVDSGKTTLVADILSDWAPQSLEFFGPDRPFLWLNNEGDSRRIKPRLFQAALHCTLEELFAWKRDGSLLQRYTDATGVDEDFIRLKNAHGMSLAQAEQVIERMRPAVVVYDMLANFRVPAAEKKADSVEYAWQCIREYAVLYNHIALATVQVSAEGKDNLFPPMSALKDSKTGAQGAMELMIMMGNLESPQYAEFRGISTPKNKYAKSGHKSYITANYIFDGARALFTQQEA